jgi:NTP pyrophosphatase (non-canonical NTP hydrolase)
MIKKMNATEKEDICYKCVSLWGVSAQILMVIEELLELALAVCRWSRARATPTEVIDEIADVNIMVMQLTHMLGINETDVEHRETEKLERLKARIEEDLHKRRHRGEG